MGRFSHFYFAWGVPTGLHLGASSPGTCVWRGRPGASPSCGHTLSTYKDFLFCNMGWAHPLDKLDLFKKDEKLY